MDDTDPSESPLDTVASTVNERTIEAFKVLGNETRLAILLALWEATDPSLPVTDPSGSTLSFSELHERVDVRSSGNFSYHLDKLVGPFVREAEAGYTLAPPAEQFLHAVLAGTLTDSPSFEGVPLGADCPRCGGPVVIDYGDGKLVARCTDCEGTYRAPDYPPGTLVHKDRLPAGLTNRTPREFFRDTRKWDRHREQSLIGGVCPECSGAVTATLHVCEDHETDDGTVCDHCGRSYEFLSQFACEVCKESWSAPSHVPLATEMAVKAFFYEHGLDFEALLDDPTTRMPWAAVERVELNSEEPPELVVTVELDGDRLEATIDDEARVTDVTEVAD